MGYKQTDTEILRRLDLRAEAEAMNVRFVGKPTAKGWLDCFAVGRDESHASAGICIASDNGSLGRYKDHASADGKSLSFFDLAVKLGKFATSQEARQYFAKKTGVELPTSKGRGHKTWQTLAAWWEKEIGGTLAGSWMYHHADGTESFVVCRFNLPNDDEETDKPEKEFRPIHKRAGGTWKTGDPEGLLPLYRLPTLPSAKRVYLSEGEKTADALVALGLVATTSAHGAKSAHKTDFAPLAGKDVVLLPDADEAGERFAADVMGLLTKLTPAPTVRVVKLPDLPPAGDAVEFIAARRGAGKIDAEIRAEIEALADSTAPVALAKVEPIGASDKGKGNMAPTDGLIKTLADVICKIEHFAQDAGGKLYYYTVGVYKPKAEQRIKAAVKSLVNEWKQTTRWCPKLASDVVEYIRVDAPELWERPPLDVVNVKNGLLRVADRVLLPHTPAHLSPVQLPVTFDPKATCPATEKFVGEVFPADAICLAWEIPAYLMLPSTSIQKAVLLTGPGGNGKSTWLAQLIAFLGKGNTSALSLHKLEADKFSAARLYGKLANICPDLPSEHLAGTSVFKTITGGDTLTGEYKFRDSFDFTPFARLVFSANSAPQSADSSQAFFERWHVIPFERSFRGTAEEITRDILDARLASPDELSGLLNKALDALQSLKRGFSQPASVRAAWQEFRASTDPLAVWLDRSTIDTREAITLRNALRIAFNANLERQGKSAMTEKAFGLAFRVHRPAVQVKQRTVGGIPNQWCYVGIGLISADETGPAQQAQQGQLDSSTCYLSREREGEAGKGVESVEEYSTKRANPVDPVDPVDPVEQPMPVCNHLDASTWEERDGACYCRVCKGYIGRVRK